MYSFTLHTPYSRERARRIVDAAPDGFVFTVKEPTRTLDQNAKLWAMLSDVAMSKPEGRCLTPEDWKCLFMHACGHETMFQLGLDGRPFPVGFRSSRLSKGQMAQLITFVQEYGDRHAVRWSDNA
jgi:hypothetical protein